MAYVDGFVIPVPKDKLEAYKDMARARRSDLREHGAIGYVNASATTCPMAS